ncbi:MAG: hypothetical protein JXA09_03945 [Anaerolineae bacterium]|nr:hypothetical protein [Anaerolineae bacterium]
MSAPDLACAHSIDWRAVVEDGLEIPVRLPADTPEARLILAVVLQAVADRRARSPGLRQEACAFLEDERVQDLTQALWGVRTSASLDARNAARAIAGYRITLGKTGSSAS